MSDNPVPWEPILQQAPKDLKDIYDRPLNTHHRGNGHFDIIDIHNKIVAHVYCWDGKDIKMLMDFVGEHPPIQRPPPPLGRILREGDSGPYCLRCDSSLSRKWWGGRKTTCINEQCSNYSKK